MSEINWGLAGGNNALAHFQFGVGLGQQATAQRDARDQRNALLKIQQDESASRIADRTADNQRLDTEAHNKALEAGHKAIANAAFDIIQTPPEQRAAKWDAYVTQFNMPELVGQYSDQRLNEVVATAGISEQFQQFQQPRYAPVGEGGLAGFQYGQPIQQGGQPQNFGNVPPPPEGFQLDEGGPGVPPPGAGFPR